MTIFSLVSQEYYFMLVKLLCHMYHHIWSLQPSHEGDGYYSHSQLEETEDQLPKDPPHTSASIHALFGCLQLYVFLSEIWDLKNGTWAEGSSVYSIPHPLEVVCPLKATGYTHKMHAFYHVILSVNAYSVKT